ARNLRSSRVTRKPSREWGVGRGRQGDKGTRGGGDKEKEISCSLVPSSPCPLVSPSPCLPFPTPHLEIELQSHPHRPRFDRSSRREEIAQARCGEIYELRAEAEDRRVERVERLDLKLSPGPLAECELARQPQVERVGAWSTTGVARQIAR